MIGAEVEHRETKERERNSRPIRSAVEGLTRRTPPVGVIAQSGAGAEPARQVSEDGWPLLALRRLSPPNKKISEFSTKRSAIAVAMVVLKRMLPQSENGVLVVMIVERF